MNKKEKFSAIICIIFVILMFAAPICAILTADEAKKCELNHAKIKANTRIIKYIHFNYCLEHRFIPDRLIVDLGDGKQHIYQLWRDGDD